MATVPSVNTPIGALEVAAMLQVKNRTVHQWVTRNVLPTADYPSVNGSQAWKRKTILRWAGETGRIRLPELDALAAEYRAVFGKEPAPPRSGGRKVA